VKFVTSEKLGLIQIGGKIDYPLNALIEPISARYPWMKTSILPPLAESIEAFDSRRNQYHSTRILVLLEKHVQTHDRLLGVTSLDLFVPDMKFVFGEARSPGRVDVISTIRLRPKNSSETELFRERIVKETVHEIGHMIGLKHCSVTRCVRHFSERLTDTDLKSPDLCRSCQSQLRARVE
jgi:archaemetzincin